MDWISLSFVFVTISIYMLFQVSPTDVACCHECSQHPVFGCQSGREVPKWKTMETVERNGIINSGWSAGGRWSRRREKTDTGKDRCNEKSTYEEKEKWVKKASKPKKPQWCCTALGRWGFQYFLVWFVVPLLVPSSSSYLSSFSSLLSPGCVGGDKSLLFGVAKNDYRRFQQDLQAWWEKGWNEGERRERGRETERRYGKSQGHRRTRSAAINYTGQVMLSHY